MNRILILFVVLWAGIGVLWATGPATAKAPTPKALTERVQALVTEQNADPDVTLTVTEVRINQPELLDRARLVERVSLLEPLRRTGQVTVKLEVRLKSGEMKAAFAMVSLEASARVWVVARPVASQGALSAACEAKTVRIDRLSSDVLRASTAIDGLVASRALTPGTVLTKGAIVAPTLVRRGDGVHVTVRSGDVNVATRGEALGTARLGERVRIRLSRGATRQDIDAIVRGDKDVEVTP